MTSSIKISAETRKKLIADLAKVQETGYDIANITVDTLMSRAQVGPEEHLLDIMYQDGLKAAMKTLISYYAVPVVNFDQEYPMHAGFSTYSASAQRCWQILHMMTPMWMKMIWRLPLLKLALRLQ